MIQIILRGLLPVIALLAMAPASAADTYKVNRSAVYENESIGTPAIRAECDWNTVLVNSLVSNARGAVVVTDEDLSKLSGKTLKLLITSVHGAPSGGGPSWASISAEVRDNGKLVRIYSSNSHSMTIFRGTCGVLAKIGKQLGHYIAGQLRNGASIEAGIITPAGDDKLPDADTGTEAGADAKATEQEPATQAAPAAPPDSRN